MKDFIEKYPEIAKIFYKHARNSGDYIPDYKYEEVAKELTELINQKISNDAQTVGQKAKAHRDEYEELFFVDDRSEMIGLAVNKKLIEVWEWMINKSVGQLNPVAPKVEEDEPYYYKTDDINNSLCIEPCKLNSHIMIGSSLCMECENNTTRRREYIKCKRIKEAIGQQLYNQQRITQ